MTDKQTTEKRSSAKRMFLRHLSNLLNNKTLYMPKTQIVQSAMDTGISITQGSATQYLSQAVAERHIFDAGRGWYSSLEQPFTLDRKPVQRLIRHLKEAFPLAAFSCWSTEQLSSYAQHLMSRFVSFVYVDIDMIEPVAEVLREKGYRVYADPGKTEIEKNFIIEKNTVIIRKAVSKQPEDGNHAAPIEKVLVDLVWESKRLPVIDETEARIIGDNITSAGRINMSELQAYAKRKYEDFSWIKVLNNSSKS